MYKSYIGLFRFIPISHFYVIINADKKPEKLTGSVLDLPNIKMNPPQVYMCFKSWISDSFSCVITLETLDMDV